MNSLDTLFHALSALDSPSERSPENRTTERERQLLALVERLIELRDDGDLMMVDRTLDEEARDLLYGEPEEIEDDDAETRYVDSLDAQELLS